MRRWLLVCVVSAVVLAAAAVGGAAWLRGVVTQPGPLQTDKTVLVPRGGTEALAQALLADGVIDHPLFFRFTAWASHEQGPLRAGEFAFPAHVSLTNVLAILRTARSVEHRVTIAEGLTAQQIHVVLAHAEAMTGPVPPFVDGSVLPETYSYEYGTPVAAIVARA